MFSRKTTFAIAVAAAASLSSVVAAHADELNVIVTGVYEHVLDDLIEPFRIETGHVVRMSATNAGGVIRKVEANEPADVVMTSAAGIDELLAKGRIAPDSKVEIGRMRLGVAVRPGSTIPDLATTNAAR